MKLNVYILRASDGYFLLKANEIPELIIRASAFGDIPGAVRAAAAAETGLAPEEIDIVLDL